MPLVAPARAASTAKPAVPMLLRAEVVDDARRGDDVLVGGDLQAAETAGHAQRGADDVVEHLLLARRDGDVRRRGRRGLPAAFGAKKSSVTLAVGAAVVDDAQVGDEVRVCSRP